MSQMLILKRLFASNQSVLSICKYRATSLRYRFMCSDTNSNESSSEPFARIAEILTRKNAKRVLVLVGAGISTDSGIPDFRTPGSGLYDNLSQYNLPWPEAVFDLEYFYSNPVPFYTLAKELYPSGKYKPNMTHYFIRLLHEKSRLLRVYTQNIDSLERMAGIPLAKIVEAHGTFLTSTCTVCQVKAALHLVKKAIDRSAVAKCSECGNVVKPDIVFFGEQLPRSFWQYEMDIQNTDLVFVMGTSLEVYPFASVAEDVPRSVPRVLFNRELVGSFRHHNRSSDIPVLGNIVASVQQLARALNWEEDLRNLMKQPPVDLLSPSTTKPGTSNAGTSPSVHQKRNITTSNSVAQLTSKLRSVSLSSSEISSDFHGKKPIAKSSLSRTHKSSDTLALMRYAHSTGVKNARSSQPRPEPKTGLATYQKYNRRSSSNTSESSKSGYSFLSSSSDSSDSSTSSTQSSSNESNS